MEGPALGGVGGLVIDLLALPAADDESGGPQWDTAGLLISIRDDRLMTHSSQWHSSQNIFSLLGSSSFLNTSATVENSSVPGIFSFPRSNTPP